MARNKKEDNPAQSKRVRSFRNKERRQRRRINPDIELADDFTWLIRNCMRVSAMRVLNEYPQRPYWLSVPDKPNPPVSSYYPCNTHKVNNRIYYGFLFREHRDNCFNQWDNARKELTEER